MRWNHTIVDGEYIDTSRVKFWVLTTLPGVGSQHICPTTFLVNKDLGTVFNVAPFAGHRHWDIGGQQREMPVGDAGNGHLPLLILYSQQIGIVARGLIADKGPCLVLGVPGGQAPLVEQGFAVSLAMQAVNDGMGCVVSLGVNTRENDGIILSRAQDARGGPIATRGFYRNEATLAIIQLDGIIVIPASFAMSAYAISTLVRG